MRRGARLPRPVLFAATVFALVLVAAGSAVMGQPEATGLDRARLLERTGDLEGALAIYDAVATRPAPPWQVFLLRGQVNFRLARIPAALTDFDHVVALAPEQEPYLWQRGIAQYYAGRYEDCRRQFELHRTVNPDDVENAAWHMLCVAARDGWAEARAAALPVGPDPRRPMTVIYDLYRGKARLRDLLAAGGVDPPDVERNDQRAFYTFLYGGLYLEAIGQTEQGRTMLAKAATLGEGQYMGEVARVHLLVR